jgi:hypothetical protein
MNKPEPMTDKEAAAIAYTGYDDYWTEDCNASIDESWAAWASCARAIVAARDAQWEQMLAKQESVATVAVDGMGQIAVGWIKKPQHNDRLYAAPQPAQEPNHTALLEKIDQLETAIKTGAPEYDYRDWLEMIAAIKEALK